jgi:large subunit ribosomal protein L25
MVATVLKMEERTNLKHSENRSIRSKGSFPAVVYGNKKESRPVAIDSTDFIKALREVGRNGILTLSGSGENVQVMLHELQTDPLKNEIIHADFYIVDMASEVEVSVNIHIVGEALGVKSGGVLQQSLHVVSLTALPGNIPTSIDVDVSNLDVNETIYIKDLPTGKYSFSQDENQVVASILPPKVEDEVDSGETQDGADETDGTKGDEGEK